MARDTTNEVKTVNGHDQRNFLATFLLATSFGVLGLRHFYLGDKKLGWVRLGLFVGGYLFAIIMALMQQISLMVLGFIAISIAVIWAIIDFFYVYFAVKTDANGQPLTASSSDKRWAQIIFWTFIGFAIFSLLLSIIAMSFAENAFKNSTDSLNGTNNTSQPTEEEIRSLLDAYQRQQ